MGCGEQSDQRHDKNQLRPERHLHQGPDCDVPVQSHGREINIQRKAIFDGARIALEDERVNQDTVDYYTSIIEYTVSSLKRKPNVLDIESLIWTLFRANQLTESD